MARRDRAAKDDPTSDALPSFYVGRLVAARPRLFVSIAVAIACYAVFPRAWEMATRVLLAWDAGTVLYVATTLLAMAKATPKTIRYRAQITDVGQFVILVLVSLAACAAIGAIFAHLGATKDLKGLEKGVHLGLAVFTIVAAWVFIHLTYALHYAHEYFDTAKRVEGESAELKGGVNFPGTDEPDYWDFVYFSFIIGVASQTADVSITSKVIRRTSLAHSILSFFFNSAVLALTINIVSGLI